MVVNSLSRVHSADPLAHTAVEAPKGILLALGQIDLFDGVVDGPPSFARPGQAVHRGGSVSGAGHILFEQSLSSLQGAFDTCDRTRSASCKTAG